MIIPIKQILLEAEFNTPEYDPNELINLIGKINAFRPFINCSEELDRSNRVKSNMIDLITSSVQAVNQGKEEWYGPYNDPNNPSLLTESIDDNYDLVNNLSYIIPGAYLAHLGITKGAPKALGLRTEYHTTSTDNAKLINNSGYLDPNYGGYNGASEKISSGNFMKNSLNHVHITGALKPNITKEDEALSQKQNRIYKILYNSKSLEDFNDTKNDNIKLLKSNIPFLSKSKTMLVMEPKDYFNKERFQIDNESQLPALKTTEKVRVHNNEYEALLYNLRNLGAKK